LQEQTFGETQFPLLEQTVESEEFFPEQILNWHWFPVYPLLQEQTFGAIQVPLLEQTVESDEFFPKQRFNWQLFPTYPELQTVVIIIN
jgi:hypothetical protein